MSKSIYIHLINGKLAYYDKGYKTILYANMDIKSDKLFVESLDQIKEEVIISKETDKKEGVTPGNYTYGYFRVIK